MASIRRPLFLTKEGLGMRNLFFAIVLILLIVSAAIYRATTNTNTTNPISCEEECKDLGYESGECRSKTTTWTSYQGGTGHGCFENEIDMGQDGCPIDIEICCCYSAIMS